ncbi:hypothetical protein Tco_0519220 [Tanacetum coccineum]
MVISKYFLDKKWSRPSSSAYGQTNMWHQSKPGRSLRKRLQYDFIQRKLRREKEAQIGTCIRQITQDCKEMLRKKMEEIKLSETEKVKNEVLRASKPSVSIKYPGSIHFKTKCMLKGIDQGHWDNICLGGYLGVYFGNEFGKIGEILGLSKQDGEEIKRCYINYLDVFTSYYKTARVSTRNVEEGNGFNCLTSHQSDFAEIRTPNVEVAKGKEKMEHFGIELEDTSYESDNLSPIHPSIKGRQTMSKDNQGVIKGPIKLESEVKEDSNNSSSEDFTIVA